MATRHLYTLPVEQTQWQFDGATEINFTWEYDDERETLLQLYDKGKKQQWDAAERIDWSEEVDWDNPMSLPDESIAIFGSDAWNKMNDKNKAHAALVTRALTMALVGRSLRRCPPSTRRSGMPST